MAKDADGPISGRTGFGWEQASKAGAPYIATRSGNQMNWSLKERAAQRELRDRVQQNEKLDRLVKRMVAVNPSALQIVGYLNAVKSGSWIVRFYEGSFPGISLDDVKDAVS